MSKKYIFMVLVLLVLVLAGGGYYFWKTKMQQKTGVDVVVVSPAANPVENVQSANPYDKTNPFSNIKVNPFD